MPAVQATGPKKGPNLVAVYRKGCGSGSCFPGSARRVTILT